MIKRDARCSDFPLAAKRRSSRNGRAVSTACSVSAVACCRALRKTRSTSVQAAMSMSVRQTFDCIQTLSECCKVEAHVVSEGIALLSVLWSIRTSHSYLVQVGERWAACQAGRVKQRAKLYWFESWGAVGRQVPGNWSGAGGGKLLERRVARTRVGWGSDKSLDAHGEAAYRLKRGSDNHKRTPAESKTTPAARHVLATCATTTSDRREAEDGEARPWPWPWPEAPAASPRLLLSEAAERARQ